MYGHLLVPEAMCRSAAIELHIWCPVHSKHVSAQQICDAGLHPPSFGSEELFSVPTSDLCKSLTNAPSVSASQAMRCLH